MNKIIQITKTLRLRDYDQHQYVTERRAGVSKKTGKDVWRIIGFHGSVKSAHAAVRTEIGTMAADIARTNAHVEFDASECSTDILDLPDKPKKKVKS